jgi:hypothetical protein
VGCQLPDAILRGKRSSFGLIAGPSCALRLQEVSSEASGLAGPDACGRLPGKPDGEAFVITDRFSALMRRVGHRFWRCVGPVPRV